jgi:predicted phage tail protein
LKRVRHVEALLREQDKRYAREAKLRSQALKIKQIADEQALELARAGQTYRDEQSNRLREQISQERTKSREREAKFLTKEEYDRRHEDLMREVSRIATIQAEGGGKSAGLAQLIAYGIGAAAVVVAVISQLH